ncbi:hypothetical protein IGI41_000190 [Enterococcus sp. DIV0876]
MKKFNTYYTIIFSLFLLLLLMLLMQHKEYPDYFILTFVYLVSAYTLLDKFKKASIVSKAYLLVCLLILSTMFLMYMGK